MLSGWLARMGSFQRQKTSGEKREVGSREANPGELLPPPQDVLGPLHPNSLPSEGSVCTDVLGASYMWLLGTLMPLLRALLWCEGQDSAGPGSKAGMRTG